MILVDDRERNSGVCEALAALQVCYRVQRLPLADYVVGNSVFVERKTCADFTASMADRRLFQQAAALRKNNKRAVLIIEGAHLPGAPSVRGALCSLAVQWCLPVLRSNDAADTAWLLAHIGYYQEMPAQPMRYHDFRAKRGISSLERRMLMQLRNVGPRVADALLAHFGSLAAVVTAPTEALMQVPGVGAVVAGQIALLHQRNWPQANV
jgi:Fanconi anemia group M protein